MQRPILRQGKPRRFLENPLQIGPAAPGEGFRAGCIQDPAKPGGFGQNHFARQSLAINEYTVTVENHQAQDRHHQAASRIGQSV